MKPKPFLALCSASASRQPSVTLALSIAALLCGQHAQGAVKTWVGNTSSDLAGSTNYTTANAPVSQDSLSFNGAAGGGANTTLTNTLANAFNIGGITFNSGASAFILTGNSITLSASGSNIANITNNSTALQTINLNIATTVVRTITTTAGGGNITLGGNITGTNGGITKNGLGTLIQTGTNSYTGATTVNAGILQISGAGNHTGSAMTVNPNGTLIVDNIATNNNARIGDSLAIALNGGSFLFKGNASGASADAMGVFTLNGPSLISISTTSVTGRAQIAANRLNYTAGTGATLVNGVSLGSQIASTAGIPQFTITNAPTLVGGTAGLASGINSGVYNTNIVPFLLGEATATTGGLGTASGNANTFVTYSATGGLRPLNLTDEFDTSTTLAAGNNVRVTGATAVSSNIAINSMILDSAGVSIDDGMTLTNTSGAMMFSSTNSIVPTGTTGALAFGTAAAQITVLPTFTGTISSAISGTGGLVKNGTGNLILSGGGSYTGPTSVNGGTVSFTGAYTPSDSASTLIVNNPNKGAGNNVILNLSTTVPTTVGSLSGTNSTPSSGTNTSKIDNGGQLLTINQAVTGTFDGGISGAGGLTKTGSGNLFIGSNSTYTGPTIISGGILRLTSTAAGSMASTSSINVASGASLELVIPGSATNSLAAPLTLAGNGVINTLNIPSNNTQTNNFTGGITLVGGATIRTFGLANAYNFSTAKITGDATTYGLRFQSEGGNSSGQPHTYTINVAADYTGNTTLSSVSQQGIIKLGVANALPTTTILTLIGSGNANSAPSLDLNGKNQTLAGLSAANATGVPRVVNSVATASTLTIDSTANQTMAGVLGGAATNNNNFALTKTGSGILSLSGANTYTGGTAVNGGSLSLLNTTAKPATGAFTVASGATLGLGVSAASNPYTSANVDSLFAGTLTGITNHANSNVGIDTTGGNFTYATSVSSTTRGLTKLGANTLTLTGTSSYSGPTTVQAGTLQLSNNSAAGTGAVAVSGASAVTLLVDSGITIANDIAFSNSNASSNVKRVVAATTGLYTVGTSGNLTSSFAGGKPDTTAKILQGTNSSASAATLTMSFSDTSTATNDAIRYSDVFSVSGTGSDLYVLQLSASGLAADSVLGYNNGTIWDLAINGNSGTNTTNTSYLNYAGSFSAFQAFALSTNLADYQGAYGFDTTTNNLWAVVNYGGSFSAVPESTSALAGILLGGGLLRRRRQA